MRYLMLLAAGVMVLTACEDVGLGIGEEGSGTLVTETREVGEFSKIDVGGAVNLRIDTRAGAPHAVVIRFDDNLLDNLTTEVRGDTLVIGTEGSIKLTGNAEREVAITMPLLASLEASGATDVEVSGEAETLVLEVSGASSVDLRDLGVTDIELDISGASNVDVSATGVVSGEISGASNLNVYGEPSSVLVDSSGASSVDIKN